MQPVKARVCMVQCKLVLKKRKKTHGPDKRMERRSKLQKNALNATTVLEKKCVTLEHYEFLRVR